MIDWLFGGRKRKEYWCGYEEGSNHGYARGLYVGRTENIQAVKAELITRLRGNMVYDEKAHTFTVPASLFTDAAKQILDNKGL